MKVWTAIALINDKLSQLDTSKKMLKRTKVASADPVSPNCCTMPAVNIFVEPSNDIHEQLGFTLGCAEISRIHFPLVDPFNIH
jgi:hypothetical protein